MAEALGIAHYTGPDVSEAQRGPFAWARDCWGSYSAGIVAFEPYTLALYEERGNTGKRPYTPLSPHGVQSPARDLGDWYAEAQRLHNAGQQLNLGAIPGDYFVAPDGEIRASLCCDFDSVDEFQRAYSMWPEAIDRCPVVRTPKGFHVWFSYAHAANNKGVTGRDGQQGSLTLDLFGSGGSCVRLPGCYSASAGKAGGPPVRTALVSNHWQPCTPFGRPPSELAQLAHDGCTAERLRLEIERLYADAGLLARTSYTASLAKYERRHGTRTDRAAAATCGAAAAPLTPGQQHEQPQCADAEKSRAIAYYAAAVRNACARLATCTNGHETMVGECTALAKLRNGHEGELADFGPALLSACLDSWAFKTKSKEATADDLQRVLDEVVPYVRQREKPLSWAEIAPDRPAMRGSAQRTWIPRRSVSALLTAMLKEGQR